MPFQRRIASTLDTALLVFFVLVLVAVGWSLVKALLGTVLFFGKLAILALRRRRHPRLPLGPQPPPPYPALLRASPPQPIWRSLPFQ